MLQVDLQQNDDFGTDFHQNSLSIFRPAETLLMLWLCGNNLIKAAAFLALADIPTYKNNSGTWEGPNSVCSKLKPARSKSNEILQINVLQKFSPLACLMKVDTKFSLFCTPIV